MTEGIWAHKERFTLKCNKNFFFSPMCFKALALKKKKKKWISFRACNWTTRCQSKHVCAWRGGGGFMYITLLFDRLCGWAPSSVVFLLICRHFFLFLAAAFHWIQPRGQKRRTSEQKRQIIILDTISFFLNKSTTWRYSISAVTHKQRNHTVNTTADCALGAEGNF